MEIMPGTVPTDSLNLCRRMMPAHREDGRMRLMGVDDPLNGITIPCDPRYGILNTGDENPDAARYAGAILTHRQRIADRWMELVELDADDPAAEFIRDQLDTSILALANWFMRISPEHSPMAALWRSIRPSSEVVARAVMAFSVLPEAVRGGIADQDVAITDELVTACARFSSFVAGRILQGANFDADDARWESISKEIEARYEAQRLDRVRRLEALIEIAHTVSTARDAATLYERIASATSRVTGCDYVEISLLDERRGELQTSLVAFAGIRRPELEQQTLIRGLVDEVLEAGEPLLVPNYVTACRQRDIEPFPLLNGPQQRAWMGAPICIGNEVLGVLAVSGTLRSFDREELELIDVVARQTAVALQNRKLLENQRRNVEQLRSVNMLASVIADIRDVDTLLETAVAQISSLFNYDGVTIQLQDPDGAGLRVRARFPTEAQQTGETTIDSCPEREPHVASETTVPIVHSGQRLGVLEIQSRNRLAFSELDMSTLSTIADQIASGIENSRLFAEEAARTRELRLMLLTTRAASSSLQLDEVLDRLAGGLAEAAGADDCLVHLFDVDERHFHPAVHLSASSSSIGGIYRSWCQVLPIEEHPELRQLLEDGSPVLACPFPSSESFNDRGGAMVLVPLRTRERTLGFAVMETSLGSSKSFPEARMRLIQGVADSAALAVANARLYARAHGLAIAEERGRLAQEIHDTLAQGLTAIALQLDLADSYLPSKAELAACNVRRALELSRQNLEEARRSVLDLRSADVHHVSLSDAISQLLRRLAETSNIDWEFTNEGLSHRLSARIEVGLYRIAEEALENARKHSNASTVQIRLRADADEISMQIEDDGVGFDPALLSVTTSSGDQFGLVGIRERARLMGGTLTVSTSQGLGTRVDVTIPDEVRLRPGLADWDEHGENQ